MVNVSLLFFLIFWLFNFLYKVTWGHQGRGPKLFGEAKVDFTPGRRKPSRRHWVRIAHRQS